MEVYVLMLQARTLMWVGICWLALGLWLGFDPATVAWRAAIGAVVSMVVVGWLARQVAAVMEDRMAADMAERQMAEEKAKTDAENAAKAKPPVAPRPVAKARAA